MDMVHVVGRILYGGVYVCMYVCHSKVTKGLRLGPSDDYDNDYDDNDVFT